MWPAPKTAMCAAVNEQVLLVTRTSIEEPAFAVVINQGFTTHKALYEATDR